MIYDHLRILWRFLNLLLENIGEARFQFVFLFYEYRLFCLNFQQSLHIKVDAKEVTKIFRIHIFDIDPQLPPVVADSNFPVHDSAYTDTKHISVMVKQQLISEISDFFVKRFRDFLAQLSSLRLLVYVLPIQRRH